MQRSNLVLNAFVWENVYKVSQNMLHFQILIKLIYFFFKYFYFLKHGTTCENLIMGREIIVCSTLCISDDTEMG